MFSRFFPLSRPAFRARSSERDRRNDERAVMSIATALELAQEQAEAERAGLDARITDLVSRAALAGGNDLDDWLTRSDLCSRMLSESDAEIRRGQERVTILEQHISEFRYFKSELRERFPEMNLEPVQTRSKLIKMTRVKNQYVAKRADENKSRGYQAN